MDGAEVPVDPVSLSLGGVVAGLVVKAVDAGGDRLVSAAAAAVERLVGRVRGRFRDQGDADGLTALAGVEEVPDSPSRLTALAEAVDRLVTDAGFRREVEGLVADAASSGVDVEAVSQAAWGSQNVQIGGVSGSQIDVRIEAPPPDGKDR